ncbi:MAG: 1-(5-phosphoribosyl)-5-[(5-phosphoribosylamino)methylideneamino]imidazole-4-carboxamide isomerase [Bacteroidetes bacterium]|nr:1-(5-phosphoribosyl)-5-[(5-phosphoribosylamino)methylideneamino]imidazole-4-carboxamide isomerase [Bacteroidota bacterium]
MIEIIPAIDIIDGKCVRLSQGDFASGTIYNSSPVETAKKIEAAGIRRLHIVDLDGARQGKMVNVATLVEIARQTSLQIDYGGGIKTEADVLAALNAGAQMINIGSIAMQQPERVLQWANSFGADKIFIGADVMDYKVAINGWQQLTDCNIFHFIECFYRAGLKHFFCTDIKKDGMLQGPSVQLYKDIIQAFPSISLVASGGVSGIKDIEELEKSGCSGAIIGKAWYECLIDLSTLKK